MLSLFAASALLLAAATQHLEERSVPEGAWLDLTFHPPTLTVHATETASDAVAHLVLANRFERVVRVASVRIAYLQGLRTLRVDAADASFFRPASGDRVRKLERGMRSAWRGICLESLPSETERVRIELELVARAGPVPRRVRQSVEARLERMSSAPPALQLPFEGAWRVSQGHGCATNHRLGGYGADFAWDFVAIDSRTGRSAAESYALSRRNRDTVSFGRPVFAAAAGRVVRIEDDVPDNDGLRNYPGRTLVEELSQPLWNFGNFIVVDVGEGGPYLLLAHLKRGSIRVIPGAIVGAGDLVAEVGNSGRSVEPHLHVQVMDRDDPADRSVSGIPALFRDYVELTSRIFAEKRDSLLRRVPSGDPPEGSVVIPAAATRGDAGHIRHSGTVSAG